MTWLTFSSPANSTCKLNSSGVEPIQKSMAMTVETEAITIKVKAMMIKTPEILLAQQGRLELPKGISVHPVNERNHFRKCRDSDGISNNASAILSDKLLAINPSCRCHMRGSVCVLF